LNRDHAVRHVSVFTTELFAHYLHIKLLSITNCHQLSQPSLTYIVQRYRSYLCNLPEVFVTDVMLFIFANYTNYPSIDRLVMADRHKTKSLIPTQLDTTELVDLLQQSAVEHLTTCRELQAPEFGSFRFIVTLDFKALYAYKRGQYQECLQMSLHSVYNATDRNAEKLLPVCFLPEFVQMMDDDIVSLIGLMKLAQGRLPDKWYFLLKIIQMNLLLYLITQCQIKLRHSVTSLARTLDCVRLVRDEIIKFTHRKYLDPTNVDLLVLKFVEKKILKYY